ncbi:MAG: signal peptidase I [Bacteroidales bacterium]|jgi:signal peptidase I|nr:signal peptidase I [Bacteroidales bacterium]
MAGRIIKYSLVLSAIVHLLLGIWWLVIASLTVLGVIWLFTTSWLPVKRVREIDLIRIPFKIVLIYVAIVLFRMLFFELIGVPMTSMKDTIKPGDMIYVSRLRYGPRLPSNPYEITWFNILVYFFERDKADFKREVWKRRRLKGYGMPEVNDIVVYAQPVTGDYFIKRCLGTPGDTIEIREGTVYVNNKPVPVPVTLIQGDGPADKWAIYPGRQTGWSPDSWGPFVLPFRGMEMVLDSASLAIYGRVLKEHEGCYPPGLLPEGQPEKVGKPEVYTFKLNYYFYVGDNRPRSNDSRFSGPVPEIHIIGKARRIILNSNKDIPFFSRIMIPMNRKKYFTGTELSVH